MLKRSKIYMLVLAGLLTLIGHNTCLAVDNKSPENFELAGEKKESANGKALTKSDIAEEERLKEAAFVKYNQMMMVATERFKNGDLAEARKVANELIAGADEFTDTDKTEYKTFYSQIEKELYVHKNANSGKDVVWVDARFADGYYFLSVLDFQEGKYSSSIDNMQKCICWNPMHSAYFCERGYIYLNAQESGSLVSAQIAYEKALELADNEEDFAAALRGLAFVMTEKSDFNTAIACLVLSKEFDPENPTTDEQITYIRGNYPFMTSDMKVDEARKALKEKGIQTTYSHQHVEVLLKMASGYNLSVPEEKERAKLLLMHARELEPQNKEVVEKFKAIK